MAEILKGAAVADAICEAVKKDVAELNEKCVTPALAIVRIGENSGDLAYERAAMKRAEKVGVKIESHAFSKEISEEEFLENLRSICSDDSVHAVLMMRPLPAHINDAKARAVIPAAKDVDGCTDISMAGVFTGADIGYPPCTAAAAMEILHHYGVDPCGQRAVVIGRSLVIGKPVAMMLMKENATVTNCHTKTKDVAALAREADILIAAAGKLKSVTAEYIKPGQIVIDVGINWDEEKGGIAGDVDFESAEPVAGAITPVPGGVGSVTSSILMKHTADAAKKSLR